MEKVLVTGSTGVLGNNLVRYLAAQGFNDIAALDIVSNNEFNDTRVSEYTGDIRDQALIASIVKDRDIVVHCASASPANDRNTIFSTIVDGTANLLEQCYLQNVKRFVYVSSTSVYGIPRETPVRESSPIAAYDPYNQAKIRAEELCRKYREKNICIPILRPRTFIGPGRLGTFAMLFEWASEGKNFPILGKGKNRYQFLDVEDLCHAVFLCVTKPAAVVNDVFNIGAREFGTIKEDYQAVLTEAGFGKKIFSLPAKPVSVVLEILNALRLSPLYKRLYKKLTLDYYVAIDKAEQQLGFCTKYSNSASLIRGFHWYQQNKQNFHKKSGSQNSVPWNQGILKIAKIFF